MVKDKVKFSEETIKNITPDMNKWMDAYAEVIDVLYNKRKMSIIELGVAMSLIETYIENDKAQLAFNHIMKKLQDTMEEGIVPKDNKEIYH